MARYPTFEEYQKTGNYDEGLERVDTFLEKSPNDVQLLTVKLQLLAAKESDQSSVLDQLLAIQPPIQDLKELNAIEDSILAAQRNEWPVPKSAGPQALKLWDNASKAAGSNMNYKTDLLSLRFSRAIAGDRLADAQNALIQLKALQPKNRVIYMAHAAVTQLLSTDKEDLSSRLALSLARKAMKEKFDEANDLDCRVVGQIFAANGLVDELKPLVGTSFGESKQVYEAVWNSNKDSVNGGPVHHSTNNTATEPLEQEVTVGKENFASLIQADAGLEKVLDFAVQMISLYHRAVTSMKNARRRVRATACFLALSALVRAFEKTNEQHYLLNAAYLTETLLKQDENIHEARMVLVYLYMNLGLGSLALRMFESLKVKEIQHDTVGHALFTGLSLVHPLGTGPTKKDMIDPVQKATRAVGVYTRHEEKLAENQASVLAHGQTGMIFDLQELQNSLRSSVTRRIIHLEQRRLDRLVNSGIGQSVDDFGPRLTACWTMFTDNRDFAATFDYGYNVEKVLYGHEGDIPGRRWILNTLVLDTAWCLACKKEPPVKDVDVLLQEVSQPDIENLKLSSGSHETSVPHRSSCLAGNLACDVVRLLLNLHAESAMVDDNIMAIRKAIERLDVEALLKRNVVLTDGLVDSYAYVDILRIVMKTCDTAGAQLLGHRASFKDLKDQARAALTAIQAHAKEQAKKIKSASVKELMTRNQQIVEAVNAFGSESYDSFHATIAASAVEGWQGVGKIKLP
jgi:N-terminal acetyltransferase B complex non-catalytic subunit